MLTRRAAKRLYSSATKSPSALERNAERFRDGRPGEVVFRWSETTHEDDDVSAAERNFRCAHEMVLAVADDGLEGDGDADLVELFG